MKFLFSILIAVLIVFPATAQDLSIKEILDRADKANTAATDSLKSCSYEFTENIIALKLNDDGSIDKADTVVSRVKTKDGTEISRKIISTNSKEAKDTQKDDSKKDDKDHKESFGVEIKLSEDNPDYKFALLNSTEKEYVVSITPRKQKPDKGQIEGTYVFDRNSFLIKAMDFVVPRPEKLNFMSMKLDFIKLDNGPLVISKMKMNGHVKALLGIVNIKFQMTGDFSDYILEKPTSETAPVSPK
jgi:hypothetical protein